jgi:mRNA interferase MazF
MAREIHRGEIYWTDWNPARGSEQSGKRPALVVQNDMGNLYGSTVIVSSVTTAYKKPYRFMVQVTSEQSGLPQDSTIDLAQIMTIDKSRLCDKCGQLNLAKMQEVDEAIKVSLGL